jgi:hypothetical protein
MQKQETDLSFLTPELSPNCHSNNILFDDRFQFSVLKPEHVEEVTKLFTKTFCDDEPMTHYLKMQYDSYSDFARVVVENAVADGFSIVALEKGKPVACALNEDLANPRPIPLDFDPNFKFIIALLEQLGEKYFPGKNLKNNEIAHLFITAVKHDFQHLGLSTQINFLAMDIAYRAGYKFMYSELTNYLNEKGIMDHLKNKKMLIGSCKYDQFVYENTKPFAALSGGANSYLWTIAPNIELALTP